MRVSFVLLSVFLTLLSYTPAPTAALGADLLKFSVWTAEAPWPGRRQAWVKQLTGSVTFRASVAGGTVRSLTYNNPMVLMGGFTPEWAEDYNDVWMSSDNGKNWVLAAGTTVDGDSAEVESFTTDKNNGGSFALLPSGLIVRASTDVFSSTNGVTWRPVTQGSLEYEQRNLPTLVATSRGVLIRAAGQDSSTFEWRNDVIYSSDSGKNWRVANESAAWSARFVNTMLTMNSAIGGGKDITYVIAGRDNLDNYNDVWASSDDGRSWIPITAQAPFMTRSSAAGLVTKDGLMILTGGFADEDLGAFNTAISNDVWLSMNGGYSWGRCILDAEWEDRFQQATVLTSDGYLLVMSGASGSVDSSYVTNDVWRSTTSFHDLPAIAPRLRPHRARVRHRPQVLAGRRHRRGHGRQLRELRGVRGPVAGRRIGGGHHVHGHHHCHGGIHCAVPAGGGRGGVLVQEDAGEQGWAGLVWRVGVRLCGHQRADWPLGSHAPVNENVLRGSSKPKARMHVTLGWLVDRVLVIFSRQQRLLFDTRARLNCIVFQ